MRLARLMPRDESRVRDVLGRDLVDLVGNRTRRSPFIAEYGTRPDLPNAVREQQNHNVCATVTDPLLHFGALVQTEACEAIPQHGYVE